MNDHNATILRIIKSQPNNLANAISQNDIANEFILRRNENITPRRVRRIIESLIEQGEPIISTPHSPGGYCWGGADDEATECVNRLRKKACKIFIRARRLKRNCLAEKARRRDWEQLRLLEVG